MPTKKENHSDMWEKENKHIGLKIILVLLILISAAALIAGYKYVKEQEEAQDAELLQVYEQHLQEQTAAREASYRKMEELYRTDLETIQTYLPGIVCWGDSLTAGSAGSVSFPDTLQQLIDTAITDRYDFYGTLADNREVSRDELTRVDWKSYTVDIPVVNMGSGQENSATVAGRNGGVPYVTTAGMVIPHDMTPVKIEFAGTNGEAVLPLAQGDAGVNPVTISGIRGTLSLDLESYSFRHINYTFTRLEEDTGVYGETETEGGTVVEAGTVIETAASSQYRDYIPVVFIGTYDGEYSTVDELIAYQKAIIDHQTANKDRYIILGLYYMSNRWDYGLSYDLETFESAMLKEYGDHFINVRKYMCSDGLSDAGISATAQDKRDIEKGLVPSSLRSAADPSELNAKGYTLLGRLVYDRMDKLGYFEEVKDELGITALEIADRQNAAGTSKK